VSDDTFLLLFNAHHEEVKFVLPDVPGGQEWLADFETTVVPVTAHVRAAGDKVAVAARDVRIFRRVSEP
jgi:glycogen operon protein